MEFFNTVAFGIIAMILVGSSWSLEGLVMGDAPKKKVDPSVVQFFGGVVSSLCSGIPMLLGGFPDCSWQVYVLTCGAYFMTGILNFVLLQVMSVAMQRGPNGIVWAIIQTALFVPFLAGVFLHDMSANLIQWFGLACMIISLVFFACGLDNQQKGKGGWLMLSFLGLCISGVNGIILTEPSYHAASEPINSLTRTFYGVAGIMVSAVVYNLTRFNATHRQYLCQALRRPILWYYVGTLQFFSLFFAYFFQYPGINILAKNDMGGVGLPLMYASCIVAFTLCSIFLLKEKIKWPQMVALGFSLVGIVTICWK